MSSTSSNDNSAKNNPTSDHIDPHGQAALLLVESLVHELVARSVVTLSGAIEVVQTAIDVSLEMATELQDDQAGAAGRSALLLQAISRSLGADAPRD